MIYDHAQMAAWPLYEVTSDASNGALLDAFDEIGRRFDAHEQLALRRWSSTRTLEIAAVPSLDEPTAKALALDVLDGVLPGAWAEMATLLGRVVTEVAVPTAAGVGGAVVAGAKEASSVSRWLVVGAVAVAVAALAWRLH